MNFRAVIVTVLIVALAALIWLFHQSNVKLEEHNSLRESEKLQQDLNDRIKRLEQSELELKRIQAGGVPSGQAAPPGPSVRRETPVDADPEVEALKARIAQLEQQKSLAEQENSLLVREESAKRDKDAALAKIVDDARLVGRVMSYNKDANLLIFKPVGQPSLVNGQELGIRRQSSILMYLVVEELDQESGTYSASLVVDEFFNMGIDVKPISEGDEVIIVPVSMERKLDLPGDAKPAKEETSPAPEAADLAPIPWETVE